MIPNRRIRFAVLALSFACAPSAAQHGPGPSAPAGEPVAAADLGADIFTRPVAEIPTPAPAPEGDRPLRDEASIPLGAPPIADVLPRLVSDAQAPPEAIPETESASKFGDIMRTVGALLLVIGLILALAWGVRKLARSQGGIGAKLSAGGRSPSGLLEVLGRYPVGGKLSLVVLRFDRRVLLIAQGNASGSAMTTLCELSDPSDVASVLSRVSESDSVNSAFREAIAHAERDVATALAPEARVPLDHFDPGSRRITQTEDGDRLELLNDGAGHLAGDHQPEISPLRRRLDALRAGARV